MSAKIVVSAERDIMTWLTFLKVSIWGGIIAIGLATAAGALFVGRRYIRSIVSDEILVELTKLESARQDAIATTASTKTNMINLDESLKRTLATQEDLETKLAKLDIDRRQAQQEVQDVRSDLEEAILDRADQAMPSINVINLILKSIVGFEQARNAAASSLIDQLLKAHVTDEVRQNAAKTLQELSDYPPALSALVEALNNPLNQGIIDIVLGALGVAIKQTYQPYTDRTLEIARDALPQLQQMVADAEHPNIVAAVGTLGDFRDIVADPNEIVGWLINLTAKLPIISTGSDRESVDPEFAQPHNAVTLAFSAYGSYSTPAVIEWLRSMLEVPNVSLRKNAAIALGEIGSAAVDSVGALSRLSRKRSEISDVRKACAEAVAKIKGDIL